MRMNREDCQLLIIDLQERRLPGIEDQPDIVRNCARLVEAARRLGVPVSIAECDVDAAGPTVELVAAQLPDEANTFERMEFSCLDSDPIRDHLLAVRENNRNQIVVAGLEAHIAVAQSVMDLLDEEFDVFVAADATGARALASKDLAMRRLDGEGAEIVNCEMVIYEWLERSGTVDFRELQALLK